MSKKFLAAILAGLFAASLTAAEENKYSKNGFFIGISGYNLAPRGDLNESLVLWHFEKAFYVPKMKQATGFGLGFGFIKPSAIWDIVFLRSSHETDLEGTASQTIFYSVEATGRALLFKKSPIQPNLLFGISIPWLQVRKGAQLADVTSNATYYGMGLNLGAGLTIHLLPRLFISGGVVYRYLGFLYVSGEGKGRDINDLRVGHGGPEWGKLLRTQSLGPSFGMSFIF